MVSKKSGHLYERRLIEKYIQEDGKCPISGEIMDANDLVSVKGAYMTSLIYMLLLIRFE